MSQIAALNATTDNEHIAFGILKQFLRPSFPHGFTTIFGTHSQTYLPFPTSIPLIDKHCEIPLQKANTSALLESMSHADRGSYAHATNHAAHVYNFAHFARLTKEETICAYYAALLHDVGKLYYMEYVKLPRKLTPDEKSELNKHTILSYVILSSCGYPDTVRYSGLFHHYNHNTKYGYPQINDSLWTTILSVASEYGLPVPKEPTTDFSHITQRQWYILNTVTVLDSLDAAIDPNRKYKTTVKLTDVCDEFDKCDIGWKALFMPELKKPFEEYVKWLEKKLVS